MLSRLNSLLKRRQDRSVKDGILDVYSMSSPPYSGTGYAKGCLWHDLSQGKLYINAGTIESPMWTDVGGVTQLDLGGAIQNLKSSTCALIRESGAPSAAPSETGPGTIYCDMYNHELYVYLNGWKKISVAS